MPWKECQIVEERLRFIARLLDGEKMAGLCREFGISRKTGYKIYHRYQDCGIDGLTDRSRRPLESRKIRACSYRVVSTSNTTKVKARVGTPLFLVSGCN